jgi:mono/diheme cytochrome c family protein
VVPELSENDHNLFENTNMTSHLVQNVAPAPLKRCPPYAISGIAIAAISTALFFTQAASSAQGPRSASDGVYSQAQQKRGEEIYTRECSTCHGATMRGGEGSPGLTGADFAASWNGQTVADLFEKIRQTMPAPPDQPGKLSPQQNADVVAHILSGNAFPAGDTELPTDVADLKRIRITVKP